MSLLTISDTAKAIAAAIAKFENSAMPQNNNPGDLVYTGWEGQLGGQPGGAGGFAQFPSVQAGLAATEQRVQQLINSGHSVNSLIDTWSGTQYAGNSPASVQNYKNFVAQSTGLNPSTPINQQSASGASSSIADTEGDRRIPKSLR